MFERACRSNSSSTSSSSGETKSKMRFADSRTSSTTALCSAACIVWSAGILPADHRHPAGSSFLVTPVIRELHIDAKVLCLQRSDYLLQSVTVLAGNPHHFAL